MLRRLSAVWLCLCSMVVLSMIADSAGAATRLPAITYTAFDGHTERLYPWQGESVTVLVRSAGRDRAVMNRLVAALDRAYTYYALTTARTPAQASSLNGRTQVAEVLTTCGAGCGYLGATGIEIQTEFFAAMYDQIAQHDLYDQIPFYELGRNFWFWSEQLAFRAPEQDPVVTGYAVWMRFESMAASGVDGAPFGTVPFPRFVSQVRALAQKYESDPSLTFAQTLALNRSPAEYSGTDFWASLMMQLAERHGGQTFKARFWQRATTLPTASTTADAVTNWVQAASFAACVDLAPVFYTRWGFPRPDGTVTPRPPAHTVPEPAGDCPPPPPPPPLGCPLEDNVIGGTDGNDTLLGTPTADLISAGAGDDVLLGLAGPDCLEGQSGHDRLLGGTGADRLTDTDGQDRFDAGSGDDRLDARDLEPRDRRASDRVDCGPGARDVALVDRHDHVTNCEQVQRR